METRFVDSLKQQVASCRLHVEPPQGFGSNAASIPYLRPATSDLLHATSLGL